MIDKLNSYRLSGVKEYWIIDPKQEQILLYSFDALEIDIFKAFEKGSRAESIKFSGLTADITALFSNLI